MTWTAGSIRFPEGHSTCRIREGSAKERRNEETKKRRNEEADSAARISHGTRLPQPWGSRWEGGRHALRGGSETLPRDCSCKYLGAASSSTETSLASRLLEFPNSPSSAAAWI